MTLTDAEIERRGPWLDEQGNPKKWNQPRFLVHHLGILMEKKLRENDHKGLWGMEDIGSLFAKLSEECGELSRAFTQGESEVKVWFEAADVANIAMMIADLSTERPGTRYV
jgi:NTP pyrophosphatase (non-canonical NTP hydrolase)